MTLTELNAKVKNVKAKAELEANNLKREFAIAHNNFKVGDVIHCTETNEVLLINDIKYNIGHNIPHVVYFGENLKLNGTSYANPKKNGRIDQISYMGEYRNIVEFKK